MDDAAALGAQDAEDEATARRLVAEGYHQVSRAYREVARLPEGKTGIEALQDVGWRDAAGMSEWHAADQFRRVYAEGRGLTRKLTRSEFEWFKWFKRLTRR